MMAPRKTYDHAYEWAGDYVREAMKGWGLATLLILVGVSVISYLALEHGGDYMRAETAKKLAEAEASRAVSQAVTKLTELAEQSRKDAQDVKATLAHANEMMRDAPAQREKTNVLLQDMVEGMKATTEELRAFRKNPQAPLPSNDGGA